MEWKRRSKRWRDWWSCVTQRHSLKDICVHILWVHLINYCLLKISPQCLLVLYNLNNDHILYHILKKTQQVKFDMIGLVMIFTNEDFIETLISNRIKFLKVKLWICDEEFQPVDELQWEWVSSTAEELLIEIGMKETK